MAASFLFFSGLFLVIFFEAPAIHVIFDIIFEALISLRLRQTSLKKEDFVAQKEGGFDQKLLNKSV